MRYIFILCFVVYFSGCSKGKKESIHVSENDLNQAKEAFTELQQALKKDNGKLWNHKLDGPILLINRDTRIIIANEAVENGELRKQGRFFVGRFPDSMIIAHSSVEWSGKHWTMYTFPLSENRTDRLNGLLHESFHRIQHEIGFNNQHEIQNVHLDTRDGRIYLTLELEALKKALNSEDPLPHIQKALLFRQYRHQLFPDSKNSENSLEMNEGIAQFTSATLLGLNKKELENYYLSQIELLFEFPTFVRSFAYFTIPVYGYFMRKKDEHWNLKINNKTNLSDYLFEFYNIKPSSLTFKEIENAGKLYRIDSIINFENDREFKRLQQIEAYKNIFLGDSILSIKLERKEIGFNPGNLVPLDTLGTVYPFMTITDNWGVLNVDSCGALVNSNWDKVTISYPLIFSDTLISGKGWRLKLKDGWTLSKTGAKYFLIKK
jgi:hypothetical protein